MPDGIKCSFHVSPLRTIVSPALLPPWKPTTASARDIVGHLSLRAAQIGRVNQERLRVGGIDHRDEYIAVASGSLLHGVRSDWEIRRERKAGQKHPAVGVERKFAHLVEI